MKKRDGIARALAMEPKVLLLDEPFGALDALTRATLQDTVKELHAKLTHTVIMITHDVEEAVFLSQRIYVLTVRPGRIKGELDVALPAEKTWAMKRTPEFLRYKHDVTDLLRGERYSSSAISG